MKNLIREIIKLIGDDPKREGLIDTPRRVEEASKKLFSGYGQDPKMILKTNFADGACKEMVILKNIEFYSTCEHHLLPFFGIVHIGYIPDLAVVGISKLARLVECFSRRLQIQERMTAQIADAILDHVKALGVMVTVKAKHFCMTARGVEKQKSIMITSAIRGIFHEDDKVRNEFLQLTGGTYDR